MSRPALEVADIFRDHGAAWRRAMANSVQSLPLVKTLRTQEPRDQRTGSIKCSYCVPGHMT
jgi:hypothetical protein